MECLLHNQALYGHPLGRMKPTRARVTEEHFTHRHLWATAEYLRSRGRADADGGGHLTTGAYIVLQFAVEAYAHCLGELVAPDEWANEAECFSRSQYRGATGKLRFLAARLGVDADAARRPVSTLRELEKRRHSAAHGRTEAFEFEVVVKPGRMGRGPDATILRLTDETFLDRAFADVESFCDRLQSAATASLGPIAVDSTRVFHGMLGYQIGGML